MRGRPSKKPVIQSTDAVAGAPVMPRQLGKIAKKKWKAVVQLMTDASTITRLDVDLLAFYCEAYERQQIALKELGTNYILDGDKGKYQNPVLHVANKALDQMLKLSKLLGLDKMTAKELGVSGKPVEKKGIAVRDRTKGPPPPTKIAGKIG